MRKLFLFLVALTLSVGLWAVDNVAYIYATGALQHQDDVTEITGSIETLNAGWYVVNGDFVIDNRITCSGEVHLILADGFTLKVMRGITVSGTGNALNYLRAN